MDASVLLPVGPKADPRLLWLALESLDRSHGVSLQWVVLLHGEGPAHAQARRFLRGRPAVELCAVDASFDYAAALELARQRCTAPFIARMDADDLVHPRRIAADVRMLQETPELGAVSCQVRLFGAVAAHPGMRAYMRWQNAVCSPDDVAREIWIEQPFCHPATTFRAVALAQVGGYRSGLFPEDYDLFLRLQCAGVRMQKRAEVHFGWRLHPRQATRIDPRYRRDAFFAVKARALVQHFNLKDRAVIIGGAGKEGGRMARSLAEQDVQPRAFVDVAPARIGRLRHGAPVHPVADLSGLRAAWPRPFFIGAVGTSGARPIVRRILADAGFREGADAVVVA